MKTLTNEKGFASMSGVQTYVAHKDISQGASFA